MRPVVVLRSVIVVGPVKENFSAAVGTPALGCLPVTVTSNGNGQRAVSALAGARVEGEPHETPANAAAASTTISLSVFTRAHCARNH